MRHTFTFKNINTLRTSSLMFDERIALMSREIVRNAEEHGAKKIDFFTMFYDGKKYIHMAHDAKPFDSLDHLKECLQPNTSGNDSGIQGSGMKLAMFLGADKEKAEVIVHSRNGDDSFTAKLTCADDNVAEIKELNKFNDFIKKIYGKYYNNFNCFVSYRVLDEGNRPTFYNAKNIALLLDMCPLDNVIFYYIPSKIIGKGKEKTYEEAISNEMTKHRKFFMSSEMKNDSIFLYHLVFC